MSNPITILVSKDEINSGSVSGVRGILDTFVPLLLDRHRNRVIINVVGYDDDPRELVVIKEVRDWFVLLFNVVPEIFYWMDLGSQYFTFYTIMFGTPIRGDGGTTISSEDVQRFLLWGYKNLNEFCSAHDISPDPSNDHVRQAVKAQLGQ